MRAFLGFVLCLPLISACHTSSSPAPPPDAVAGSGPVGPRFCDLPGSLRFTSEGRIVVPGGDSSKVGFVSLPTGFCAHFFGNVGNTRELRFAPGGELFVASPVMGTTGGGPNGRSAIVVLPDDDHDGLADSSPNFLTDLPSTQGLMFSGDWLYFQDGTQIVRVPYHLNDRAPGGDREVIADIKVYFSSLHWPKTFDQADDGLIYVGNGGDQGESCDPTRPFHGGILKLDGAPGGTPVARGLRNPIGVRCQRGHNLCFAVELAMDYSADKGGREKLIPIREGDDWGFPCCQTRDVPADGVQPVPDCSATTPEEVSFLIGDTPFPFDFEPGNWPAPYTESIFVPLHGAAGSWQGAKVVALEIDRDTGLPKPGSTLDGKPSGAMTTFASGWDNGSHAHGRPSSIAFAKDGRLFIGNDNDGNIFWVAPLELER